jgi:hypothetical protein
MGDAVAMVMVIVMEAIDAHIECWFLQVLRLDARNIHDISTTGIVAYRVEKIKHLPLDVT